MQQYIYGNLHHAGFRTVSSDTSGFFMNHADVLSPLMYYDTDSRHGELQPGEHNCFWMLTTNLKILGGQDYLFIQESGMDPYRAAAVVQGYRSDYEDHQEDLYGKSFLQLLDTRFVSSKEAMRMGEENQLASVTFADLPKTVVEPEPIAPEMLEEILLALFQRKRAIIRIPVRGAEAMARSRGYLKTIYQCLPYEKRRNNGCITGATPNMLDISKSFRIVLMDADADISDIATNNYQAVFDLKNPETIQKKETIHLVHFLATAAQEQRDGFFQHCRAALMEDGVKGDPDIDKYSTLLDEYLLDDAVLSGEAIRKWAVSLYDDEERTEKRKADIRKEIAKALPVQNLVEYLRGTAGEYENVHQFGVLKRADRNHDKEAQRDQNAALTLLMMTELPGYDCDSVRNEMTAHFASLAKVEYPCLTEESPTADTLAACTEVRQPGAANGRTPWSNELMEQICGELTAMVSNQEKRYQNNYQNQKADGDAKIQVFDGKDLISLYGELEKHYLNGELMSGWNTLIAQKVVSICSHFPYPRQAAGYEKMRERLDTFRNTFAAHHGKFTAEQDQKLRSLTEKWEYMQKFINSICRSARELEQWIQEADAAEWNPELREEEKCKRVNALLSRIPEGLSLKETKDRLDCAVTYGTLLKSLEIEFLPWGAVKAAPAQILKRIKMLENYPYDGTPKLNNRKLRSWIAQMLPENKALMMLLIQKYPAEQEELVPALAMKGKGITQDDIRELYLSGCARSVLCGQKGLDVSMEWRRAVDAFLPELPNLPRPLKTQKLKQQPANMALLIVVQILLGLAALVPGVVLLLTGSGTVGIYGIVTGVTAVCAVGFGAVAFIPKAKPGKKFLLGLAIAMVPGILAAVAGLVMNFL